MLSGEKKVISSGWGKKILASPTLIDQLKEIMMFHFPREFLALG